jgi:hypothetical protein
MLTHSLQLYSEVRQERFFCDPRFRFITTDFTIAGVKKYILFILEKSGKAEKDIMHTLSLLPVVSYQEKYYQEKYYQE